MGKRALSASKRIKRAVLTTLALAPSQCAGTYHAQENIPLVFATTNRAVVNGHLTGTCEEFCTDYFSRLGEHDVKVLSCQRVAVGPRGESVSCDANMKNNSQGFGGCFDSGRLPAGASRPEPDARGGKQAWLEEMAVLEGLSVTAFERLGAELSAHRAPSPLRVRAKRAASDERRHHAMMSSLLGRVVAVPRVPRARKRSLAEMLTENAVEGCVHETFGAAVALWQAETATDPSLRDAMRGIARDEVMHAELAHRVHAWGVKRLSLQDRQRVERARCDALSALRRTVASGNVAPHHRLLGLPTPCDAARLLDALHQRPSAFPRAASALAV